MEFARQEFTLYLALNHFFLFVHISLQFILRFFFLLIIDEVRTVKGRFFYKLFYLVYCV